MLETGMTISIPHISEEIGTTVPDSIGRFNYVSKGVADKIYDAKDFQPQFTLPLYRYVNIRNAQ
ncbi:unnamed protein product, partial [Rotaria sp. Silwood2]